MTLENWLIDIALIAIVIRQIRGRKLTAVGLLWPIGLVVYAGISYLTTIPGDPADLELIGAASAAGAILGLLCGAWSDVRHVDGAVIAVAGPAAATAWLIGMGGRLAFAIWAQTATGSEQLGALTVTHGLHPGVWPAALILMALAEVVTRTAVLWVRWRGVLQAERSAARLGT